MFRSYLVIALRALRKHKTVSSINILGLALGMSAFLIIVQYVMFQLSYDDFHENKESIYRVESRFFKNGVLTDDWPSSSGGYGPAMKREFPEITQFARIYLWGGDRIVSRDDIRHREKNVYVADADILDIFSFKLISGDPASALKEPNSVILSQSASQKYFGDADPMGKILKLSNTESAYECAVTGIFNDVPANSHIDFDMLISWTTLSSRWPGVDEFWYQHEAYTYVRLAPQSNVASIEEKFPALAEKHKTRDALKDLAWGIKLVPLTAIHLNPLKSYEREVKGSKMVISVLAGIAGLILFIAWINYINLTSARALERAKEVAIRKTAGAKKETLLYQFLFESTLVNGISLLLAGVMVKLSMPYFVELSGVDFSGVLAGNTVLYLVLTLFFALGVFFSGLYPALVIAAFHPITALKGKITQSGRGKMMRKSLVVFQFAISMVLIAISVVVFQQVEFMRNQDMGMETEQILVIRTPSATENYDARLETLRNTFLQSSEVRYVTVSSAVPGKEVAMFLSNRNAEQHTEENRLYEMLRTDHDFVNTYQLQLLYGRNFSRNIPTDRFAVILNEESVKQLGYADNESALNREVYLEGDDDKFKIIGVVKNFHQTSLKNKVTPIMLFISPDYSWIPFGYISLHVKSKDWPQTIQALQQSWTKAFPESSFDYFFLDDFIDQQYRADLAFGRLVGIFCFLAIGIACLGLLGLASYDTLLRRKEVGVRKVLGATVPQLVKLLSRDLVILVIAAYALSVPAAYFIASAWLESYSFRMSMTPWMFIMPLLILLPIAFLTVSSQTIKVASSNPIDSLRSE